MNVTLMTNGINREFTDIGLFFGLIRNLVSTGKTLPIDKYAGQPKPGEINSAKIEKYF